MTFHHTRFTSRIDRAYSSLEDGALSALCPKAWIMSDNVYSDHKPLLFDLKGEYGHRGNAPTLPKWTFRSKSFESRVARLFRRDDGSDPSGSDSDKLNRLLWAMSTASLQSADELPGDTVLTSRDKFSTARRALVALRNAERLTLRRLDRVMPELDVDGKEWSAQEEKRLLNIVGRWHRDPSLRKSTPTNRGWQRERPMVTGSTRVEP